MGTGNHELIACHLIRFDLNCLDKKPPATFHKLFVPLSRATWHDLFFEIVSRQFLRSSGAKHTSQSNGRVDSAAKDDLNDRKHPGAMQPREARDKQCKGSQNVPVQLAQAASIAKAKTSRQQNPRNTPTEAEHALSQRVLSSLVKVQSRLCGSAEI